MILRSSTLLFAGLMSVPAGLHAIPPAPATVPDTGIHGAPATHLDATHTQDQTDTVTTSEPPATVPVPSATPNALRYYRSGMAVWAVAVLVGLVVPAVVTFTGFGARLRTAVLRVGRRPLIGAALFAVAYLGIDSLANLPVQFYGGFVRQHQYGLSNQSVGQWLGDWGTALGFVAVLAAVLVPGAYLVIRRSPRRWWLYGAAGGTATMFAIVIVHPLWVAPAFDDFQRLGDAALEADILALADRAGIDGGRVWEVNKSEDTELVNAYVTGFLGTQRIVLWDTILRKLDRDQLLFVMGHEMGHYVLGHTWKMVVIGGVLLTGGLLAAWWVLPVVVRRTRRRLGFDDLGDVASLPLVVLLLTVTGLAISPLVLALSRYQEREADRFGLEITRDNHAAATAWVALQSTNLANPRPGWVYESFRATHPSIADRIEFANTYHPWTAGRPSRYESRFR